MFAGVKLYPANATTNSAAGVTDYNKIKKVLARMEKIGMRFLTTARTSTPQSTSSTARCASAKTTSTRGRANSPA